RSATDSCSAHGRARRLPRGRLAAGDLAGGPVDDALPHRGLRELSLREARGPLDREVPVEEGAPPRAAAGHARLEAGWGALGQDPGGAAEQRGRGASVRL